MSRLPVPGQDEGTWGSVLNDYLAVEHQTDGSLRLRTDGTLDIFMRRDEPLTLLAGLTIDNPGAGAGTLLLPDTSGPTGLTIGNDTNLFRSGSGQLQTSSAFFVVRATLGIAGLSVATSGEEFRRYQVNTDGKVLWSSGAAASDTSLVRNTSGGLKIDHTGGTTADPATPTLTLAPTGVTSGSPTGGGTFLINQGTNRGSAMNIYSTAGSGALGRLVNVVVANPAFDQAGYHLDYAGTANGLEVSSTSTGPGSNALNVVSTNPNDSTAGINGQEVGRGTLKVVHNYPGLSDANASVLSLRTNGAGTAAQGIFFDAENGGTTGNLMKFRQAGVDQFIMSPNGSLLTGGSLQVGATVADTGGGAGVIGLKQASIVPGSNPAAGGVILYADGGVLKWRDPNGTVYDVGGSVSSIVAPGPRPEDQSYLGWAYDPVQAANNSQPTAGVGVLVKVRTAAAGTANAICLNVNGIGSGFTADASFVALYDMSGARLGLSNDLAGILNTTGAKSIPLTAGVAVTEGMFYYVYIIINATTMPALNRAGNIGAINQNTGPGTYRFATLGAGVTSPPASLTLASSVALSTSYWAALA